MNIKKNNFEKIFRGDYCFVIAEAGSNHNQNFDTARQLVDAASDARADAVKFQFFMADEIAADTKHPIAILDNGKSLHQFYKELETPREWIPELSAYCRQKDILFMATAFDLHAVDLLEAVKMEIYKIASFEIVDIPLLKKIARTQKPIILSTGMANDEDIDDALNAIYEEGDSKVVVLHCGINYPVPFNEVNLRAMETIKKKFNVPVGYSDHTSGLTVPIAAVALGAKVIEKHFTLNREQDGPDHSFAVEPHELKQMVRSIRECNSSLGSSVKGCSESEEIHYKRGRRSLFASRDIQKDDLLTMECFSILRPGIGLKPKHIYELVGKMAKKGFKKNEAVDWGIIKR